MRIDIISLFPEMFGGPFDHSMVKRAREASLANIVITNPRDFAYDKHRIVDDSPFGGGSGMVLRPDPVFRAVAHVTAEMPSERRRVVLMCPGGIPFSQAKAKEFAACEQLVLICGHYEGVDERIRHHVIDEAASIGDYVLTGGELAAMVVTDAVVRLIPGVLGSPESAPEDSFYNGLLKYPQYTRPREFNGWGVPEVILSGDHAKIEKWRRKKSLENTLDRRPDLLEKIQLNSTDTKLLKEILAERAGG